MSLTQKIGHEIRGLAFVTLFFAGWIGFLVLLKQLLLAEYDIASHSILGAVVGVLLLAKVVLVAERISLGAWVRARPAWVDVLLRTALYGAGVAAVLLLEKALDGRHEHGGLGPALVAVFRDVDIPHVWINIICMTAALLCYNALAVIRRHLGEGGIRRVFLAPPPPEAPRTSAADHVP